VTEGKTLLKRTVLTFIALCLFGLIGVGFGDADAAQGDGGVWKPFRSEAGRFIVDMPGKPEEDTTHTRSFIGTVTNHVFVGTEDHDLYTVDYSDLPGVAVTFAGDATIFSHAKGALLKKTMGKETSFEKTTLNGMKGVHLVYDTPPVENHPRMHGESYMFLMDKRLYVVDATVSLEHSQDKARAFFKSFRINPN